jgi:hypothetical protein
MDTPSPFRLERLFQKIRFPATLKLYDPLRSQRPALLSEAQESVFTVQTNGQFLPFKPTG